jgi:hypothetical protein
VPNYRDERRHNHSNKTTQASPTTTCNAGLQKSPASATQIMLLFVTTIAQTVLSPLYTSPEESLSAMNSAADRYFGIQTSLASFHDETYLALWVRPSSAELLTRCTEYAQPDFEQQIPCAISILKQSELHEIYVFLFRARTTANYAAHGLDCTHLSALD